MSSVLHSSVSNPTNPSNSTAPSAPAHASASSVPVHPHGPAVTSVPSEPAPKSKGSFLLRLVVTAVAFACAYAVMKFAIPAALGASPSESDMRGSFVSTTQYEGREVLMNLTLSDGGRCTFDVHTAGVSSPTSACTWSMKDKRISVVLSEASGSRDMGELSVESKDRMVSRDIQSQQEIIFKRR